MSRVTLLAAASGTLFGAGLTIGGMTNPARVRGFLDIFGDWDPTLVFVMGGAVIVMAFAWAIQRRMDTPRWASSFKLPDTSDLTPKLLGGSAIFGIGWGIAGLCPGPGFAALVIEPAKAAAFVASMLGGMVLAKVVAGGT